MQKLDIMLFSSVYLILTAIYVSSNMTVEFTDADDGKLKGNQSITHKANFYSTKSHPGTDEPLERDIVMLGVYPEFEIR